MGGKIMDLSLSEEEEMLKKTARDFLTDKCPKTLVKEMEDFKYFDKKYQHEHGNDEQSFAIEFRPWSQWLAMDIDPSCYENKRTNAEIVACCLYEMSFMGYTDAEVQTCGKRLLKRVNKAMKDIKSGKAKTYTMDEVKEKLHQRIKDENQKRLRK